MSKEDFSPRTLLSKETLVQGDNHMYFSPRIFSLSHYLISGPNILIFSKGKVQNQGTHQRVRMGTIIHLSAAPNPSGGTLILNFSLTKGKLGQKWGNDSMKMSLDQNTYDCLLGPKSP